MKTQTYPYLRRVLTAASLAVAVYLAATPFSSTPSSAQPVVAAPVKEQYKIVVIASPRVEELQKELNQQASDGWKLRTAMDKMFIFAK